MKERPILFSGPMVKAILDGRKTQTRRIVKPQPLHISWFEHQQGWCAHVCEGVHEMVKCPYGQVGDQLWVRESAWYETLSDNENVAFADGTMHSRYDAGTGQDFVVPNWTPSAPHWKRRPSIFMPRWASRIQLEIVSVRVERLQDISEADAIAEGVVCTYGTAELVDKGDGPRFVRRPRRQYQELWESINGKTHPWASNPFVWVIEFQRVEIYRG